jgi:hypothetical protein
MPVNILHQSSALGAVHRIKSAAEKPKHRERLRFATIAATVSLNAPRPSRIIHEKADSASSNQ